MDAARSTCPLVVRSSHDFDVAGTAVRCSCRTHAVTKPCRAPYTRGHESGSRPVRAETPARRHTHNESPEGVCPFRSEGAGSPAVRALQISGRAARKVRYDPNPG